MKLLAIFAASVLLFAQLSSVKACSCPVTTLKKAYYSPSTETVVRATPTFTFVSGSRRFYLLKVQTVFKGCLSSKFFLIQTSRSSASCGVLLEIGTSYLLTLPSGPIPVLSLCSFYREWEDLSAAEIHFLNTREVCCKDNCTCAGSSIVNCVVAPCQFTKPPCPEATKCVDNYCGGCFAEWFTKNRYPACLKAVS